jgi:zinc protease
MSGPLGKQAPPVLAAWSVGILLTAIGVSPLGGSVERPTLAPPQGEIFEYEIAHVPVIHRVNTGSDIVAVRLYLLGGARQLTHESAGIEALLLRAAALEHGPALGRTGCRTVLNPARDWTVTGFTGLLSDLDSMWVAFARQLARPAFSRESLERARGELMTAARRHYSEPDLRVQTLAWQGVFQGHPYEFNPLGTEESLQGLSHSDLEAYWDETLVASRMLLVVVGNVGPTEINDLMAPALEQLPVGAYQWTLPPPVERKQGHWLIEQRELPTNYILGYFTGPNPGHDDYLEFRAAVALLSSQISYQVRQRQSLSYSAYAPFLDFGLPVGGIYASTSEPGETLRIMRLVLQNLDPAQYPRVYFRRFLEQFSLDQLLEQMTSDGQAEALARARLYFGDLEMADDFVKRLRSVSPSTVLRVAERYMQGIQYGYLGDTVAMGDGW